MELAVSERDTRSKYSDGGHKKQNWGAGLVVATSGTREVGGAVGEEDWRKEGGSWRKEGNFGKKRGFSRKDGRGLEKVGGGKEKRRWSLEIICTYTHT